jgi:hypothetical protein
MRYGMAAAPRLPSVNAVYSTAHLEVLFKICSLHPVGRLHAKVCGGDKGCWTLAFKPVWPRANLEAALRTNSTWMLAAACILGEQMHI